MDPLTHAASGAVAMLALPSRPMTRLAIPLAALACASPDIDLAFIHTPLEFLLLHRGITHSFAFAPFFALLLALIGWPLWRKATPLAWKFWQVWLLCAAMLMLHIWLDVCTTYGTMVFLPFSHYRVRLNSIYMIDLAITLPLLWAICFWRKKPRLQAATLIWIFFLPGIGIALNHWHKAQTLAAFQAEGKQIEDLAILPDAFAPLFWRAIYAEATPEGRIVTSIGLDWLGKRREKGPDYPALASGLEKRLKKHSLAGDVFFNFAMLPAAQPLPAAFLPNDASPDSRYLMCHDLRFGSNLAFVNKLLELRPDADMPFLFMAELEGSSEEEAAIDRIRLRFSDSGRDSQWHRPQPPENPGVLQWLVGLDPAWPTGKLASQPINNNQ